MLSPILLSTMNSGHCLYGGRRSQHPLKALIVGGGSAGLATAFALQKAGHTTIVLDRNSKDTIEAGGGEHIPPNAVKILDHWGIGEDVRSWAFETAGVAFIHRKFEPKAL